MATINTAVNLHTYERAEKMWVLDLALANHAQVFAGVDEVGRGCLAGPVVAAAVIPPAELQEDWLEVHDSKQINTKNRRILFEKIKESARGVGIGAATPQEIDKLNILQATRLAMGRALHNLGAPVPVALVDGIYGAVDGPAATACIPVVDGDARCISIAAASIIAKVTRDDMMQKYAEIYPHYGFERNVGYGTKEHRMALLQYGPTPIHRYTFAPVGQYSQIRLDL